jgi:hypothetical protein
MALNVVIVCCTSVVLSSYVSLAFVLYVYSSSDKNKNNHGSVHRGMIHDK